MRKFTVLPHVADVRLRVEASSTEELFTAALEGMNHILKRSFCKEQKGLSETRQVRISSCDTTALLVDFLSEVLTLTLIDQVIFCQVEYTSLDVRSLTANLCGSHTGSFDEDIKAVAYHEAEIKRNSRGNYQTNLVFDI
jgi:SHS2 domain-containing protein